MQAGGAAAALLKRLKHVAAGYQAIALLQPDKTQAQERHPGPRTRGVVSASGDSTSEPHTSIWLRVVRAGCTLCAYTKSK